MAFGQPQSCSLRRKRVETLRMRPSRDAGSGLGTVSHSPPAKCRCFRSVLAAGGCFGESSAFLQHTRVIHKQRAQQWTPDAEPPRWDANKTGMSSQMRAHASPSPDPAPGWHPGTHQPFPVAFPSTDPAGPHQQEMLKNADLEPQFVLPFRSATADGSCLNSGGLYLSLTPDGIPDGNSQRC